MSKFLVVLVLGLVFFESNNSQAATGQLFTFFGMNSSSLNYRINELNQNAVTTGTVPASNYTFSSDANVGPVFGLSYAKPLYRFFDLEAGLRYSNTAYAFNKSGLGSTSINQYSMMQLQIPILIRLQFMPYLSVGVGGYFSQTLSNVSNRSSGTLTTTTSDLSPTAAGLSAQDYGLTASVRGLHEMITGTWIAFELGGFIGLKDIDLDANSVSQLRTIQATTGLVFDL